MVGIVEALSLLTPSDIDKKKVRIGPKSDGGYILVDELSPDQVVMSFGIGDEYRFDEEMARRGHTVYMFDHTIRSIDSSSERMKFFRQGISGRSYPDRSLFSIEDIIAQHDIPVAESILKMDVEGAEYEAMLFVPDSILQ